MDTATIGEVNGTARSPEHRRDLFQRVNEQHDIAAFEILYELYFGDIWAKAFHPRERKAMQELLIECLDSFLSLLERKEIGEGARLAIANCLKKFLPGHPYMFTLDSLPKRITLAMVGETGHIFRTLDELLTAVKSRWAEAQRVSEPD